MWFVGYSGTIHFSNTDTKAKLPANHSFAVTSKVMHTFTSPVLGKKGYQKISVGDTHSSGLTESALVDVL